MAMTELERFKAVMHFEEPDYYPLILTLAAFTATKGGMAKLHREGLPEWVKDNETWCRYWGQAMVDVARHIGVGEKPMGVETWFEGDFEFTRRETGALIRRVKDHETAYSMPEFIEFDVRDRPSWERLKTFGAQEASSEKLAEHVRRFKDRTRPLMVSAGGTWGRVRNLMGPERALTGIYDDPELIREMIEWQIDQFERFAFPVIEALQPEIVMLWEDFCYNHGMLISPAAPFSKSHATT